MKLNRLVHQEWFAAFVFTLAICTGIVSADEAATRGLIQKHCIKYLYKQDEE